MAQLFDRLSETLHEATKELLDMFAIKLDANNAQVNSDVNDTDD